MHHILTFLKDMLRRRDLNPRATHVLARRFRQRLRPEEKHRVIAILTMATMKRANLSVGGVVSWAVNESLRRGMTDHERQIVENATYRVFEIGLNRAIAEVEQV